MVLRTGASIVGVSSMGLPDHSWKAEPLAEVCRLPDVIGLVERQEGDETAQRSVRGWKLDGRGALEHLRVLRRERHGHARRHLVHSALELGERRAMPTGSTHCAPSENLTPLHAQSVGRGN